MKKLMFFIFIILVFTNAGKVSADTMYVTISAYCPCEECCGDDADGSTSTGSNAYICNGVAVDPEIIPYGTILRIPGVVGDRKADDTGIAMRDSWADKGVILIDLRCEDHKKALKKSIRKSRGII